MSTVLNDQFTKMLMRERLETIFPWLAVDLDKRLIIMNHGYVGCVMGAALMAGADYMLINEIKATLALDFPAGTFIQCVQLNVPDISRTIADYDNARAGIFQDDGLSPAQRDLLDGITKAGISFIEGLAEKGEAFMDSRVPLTETILFLSIKIPTAEVPSDEHIREIDEKIQGFQSSLNTLRPQRLPIEGALAVWRRFMDMRGAWDRDFDPQQLLREQVVSPGDSVRVEEGNVIIKHGDDREDVIAVLSMKKYPKRMNIAATNFLSGDPLGVRGQIKVPSAMVWTIHIPDQVAKRRYVNKRATIINYQAFGPATKWIPKLALKKEGMDALVKALDSGDVALEESFNVILWCRDAREARASVSSFLSHASTAGFSMARDSFIGLPMFMNCIPLFADIESMGLTFRLKSMGNRHAANTMPIIGDWVGNAQNGHHRMTVPGAGTFLFTRRGHPLLFDLYASNAGFNFVLAGMTRSGKTVLAEQTLMDQLSMGAQVWVIEIGRGFKKLCNMFGGSHIDLRPDYDYLGLNPFSVVEELDEELDELKGIIGTMIDPTGNLSQEDIADIGKAIRAVYGANGKAATPTHVAHYLAAQDNKPRNIAMATMMHEFTENGAYGHWFNRAMNVDLTGRFVNLELIELTNRKHLLMVVLMQLMFAIGREMYTSSGSGEVRRRILFTDEASELLKIKTAALFLEGAYRRAAKSRGSIGVGLQRIADLYMTEETKIMASQTAHFIVMRQDGGAIDDLEREGRFQQVGAYGMEMMRSVRRTDEYSEAFIYSGGSMGVGRLKLDRYRQVLFATDGPEKEEVLEAMARDVDPDTAIRQFIERENQRRGE
ncbi:type IV secretion system protein TraC [Acidithiobacillus ferriphilus]|uniref:type IV secretion system protein TraC n=1 Tax=Acidithiobacillus ferriphilus TaxID=1689834 RepID=UPI001C0624ED|nr:type IV secretion system protein TraC [Acidithiobacillus ferriphilus]MBU2785247.1 type IV secretion system protein TraC [Acidithiobacillus ferriphilus]